MFNLAPSVSPALPSLNPSWPVSKPNTILNIVPQGEKHVVERLGKLHEVKESGWFLAIPFIDNIAYVVDTRERAMGILPQRAITGDNVAVDVSGVVYIQFDDVERACYGAADPLFAVKQLAMSAMRAAIGEMELDEILHNRQKLNSQVLETVQKSAMAWGIRVLRYEIMEVTPDRHISESM